MCLFRFAGVILMLTVGAATAATVNETDVPGGFGSSNQFSNPSYADISYGVDTINGTAASGNFDFLRFTDLDAGAQTLTFNFALVIPAAQTNLYANGGGQVYYSETDVGGPYNGSNAGTFAMERDPFNLPGTPTTTLTFALGSSFAGGALFVNILPQYGQTFLYALNVTGNGGGPAPVPIPPAGALLLAALALIASKRRSLIGDLHPNGTQAT